MPPTVTGFPVIPQQTACIIIGLMLFGQAMGADENGSAWDCHTNPAGTVECVGKPADPVKPEQQPTPTEPESTAAPPTDTQPAEPAPDIATGIPAPAARLAPDQSISHPAANPWRLCAGTTTRSSRLNLASIEEARRNAIIDVEADSVELQENQIYTLTGNVAFQRADQHLEAQHLVYDKQQGSVTAEGNIHYSEAGLSANSGRMQLDMNSNHAQLEDVEYYVPAGHARGSAKQVTLEGPGVQHLTKATYTTCDAAQEDWRLSAKHVTLLQEKGVGRAKGVVMRFKRIPIFYTPYLSFPLDERRKSGFLAPTIGGSEESGADVRLPFYWNIAPHRDAIITPRRLEKRGTQLGAELRYLNRNNSGTASVEYLPSDNEFGKDRSLIALEHRGRPTPRINTVLLFKEVSDRSYFEDLGDSLNIASTTHLERRAEVTYRSNQLGLSARVQDFQTVDSAISDADKPYRRLPQIRFVAASPWRPLGLQSALKAEYTYFDHDVKLSGHRLDLQPRISLPLQKAAYSIT
ncbi:MAG: LPS assembly protein LptD, partial [Gammaproteobacteria bacterium]